MSKYSTIDRLGLNALAGIFVFSILAGFEWKTLKDDGVGLNALAGIFVFSMDKTDTEEAKMANKSQCPRGHFCFLHMIEIHEGLGGWTIYVSMPSRAFLFSPLAFDYTEEASNMKSLNALAGIFVFSIRSKSTGIDGSDNRLNALAGIFVFSIVPGLLPGNHRHVSMPSRAFLFSPLRREMKLLKVMKVMSQCPRGHFCFLHLNETLGTQIRIA